METSEFLSWLITGASSGFGQSIGLVALAAGHKVVGPTRNIAKAKQQNPEFEKKGGVWLELDPGSPNSGPLFARAQKEHSVNVLVNNAGYAFIGGVEDTSEAEVRDQMEINFYGPLRATQAMLPGFRAQGRGEIVLISSGAGFIARPGRGIYSASKYAAEALHESLSHEVEALGLKVLIVEPGAFRTQFSTRLITPSALHDGPTKGYSEGYRGTALEEMLQMSYGITEVPPKQYLKGDPEKAAKYIFQAVVEDHGYLRMLLGPDCVEALDTKLGEWNRDFKATRAMALSTDVDP